MRQRSRAKKPATPQPPLPASSRHWTQLPVQYVQAVGSETTPEFGDMLYPARIGRFGLRVHAAKTTNGGRIGIHFFAERFKASQLSFLVPETHRWPPRVHKGGCGLAHSHERNAATNSSRSFTSANHSSEVSKIRYLRVEMNPKRVYEP